MSLFAEFDLPTSAFALEETLATVPNAVIEIERVVASEEMLTPHFWVSKVPDKDFEEATESDPSVRDLRRLDSFDNATLYRAEWTENIESVVYAYREIGAVILEAVGTEDTWNVHMRFDDHSQLTMFRTHCEDSGIPFQVKRLHEVTQPSPAHQFGITEKQHDALVKAWEAGYYESPAESSLDEVASTLGISQQALSQRMRKGYDRLIANTLVAEHPDSE
ncbi:bacterio-opsin activator domain-containing protein [Natrinema gelatinilyticum]|uniref:helix-turn-helix domain-containing protein n=1 Tax=Natrinema gelatinilyticum TaxID=2961571 RepID=UPI0020C4C469|nr:helix-turn-helix domain-containing protein [Natrinema gelatinilyticum]